jgi:hypothetical protein
VRSRSDCRVSSRGSHSQRTHSPRHSSTLRTVARGHRGAWPCGAWPPWRVATVARGHVARGYAHGVLLLPRMAVPMVCCCCLVWPHLPRMAGKKAAPKKKAAEEESAGKKETSKGGKGGEKEVKVPHKPAFKRHAAEEPEEKGVAEQQWNAAQWLESLGMATHSNGHRTDHHHVLTIRAHPLHVLSIASQGCTTSWQDYSSSPRRARSSSSLCGT